MNNAMYAIVLLLYRNTKFFHEHYDLTFWVVVLASILVQILGSWLVIKGAMWFWRKHKSATPSLQA
jgi:hypothetical protein